MEVVVAPTPPPSLDRQGHRRPRVYRAAELASVERVISPEQPDSILPTLGGQTRLNLAMNLHEQGILEKYGVPAGAPARSPSAGTEDRQGFKDAMEAVPALRHQRRGGERGGRGGGSPGASAIRSSSARLYPGRLRRHRLRRASCGRLPTGASTLSRVGRVLIERCISGWKGDPGSRSCGLRRQRHPDHHGIDPVSRPHRRLVVVAPPRPIVKFSRCSLLPLSSIILA